MIYPRTTNNAIQSQIKNLRQQSELARTLSYGKLVLRYRRGIMTLEEFQEACNTIQGNYNYQQATIDQMESDLKSLGEILGKFTKLETNVV